MSLHAEKVRCTSQELCCAGMQFAKLGQRMPSDSTTLGEGLSSPVKGALLLARLFSSHYVWSTSNIEWYA